jgi:glyoxalase family protein
MKAPLITGLHHVTSMASAPQKNVDFYAGILGLRLIKKTINFDAPDIYHLYYGDESGTPGSLMTFFPFNGISAGRQGKGQAVSTTFSISTNSVEYWIKRLNQFKVKHKAPQERFDEVVIYFEDYDGLGLELIANDNDDREPFTYGHIPKEHAIRGFYSIELWEDMYERTESVLVNQLNHQFLKESGTRRRYAPLDAKPGQIIDIVWSSENRYGIGGSGTVHHVAFDTPSLDTQLEIREKVAQVGLSPTPVIDRQYFDAVYFREPGGVLFEISTNKPKGFMTDEEFEHLGEHLMLPSWLEGRREYIEKLLEPITLNPEKYASTY